MFSLSSRWRPYVYVGVAILICAALFSFLPWNLNALLIKPLEVPRIPGVADIGIVLGGGLHLDGTPSDISSERVTYAVAKSKAASLPLMFSGGETSFGVEAEAMDNEAKQLGYTGLDHIEASSHSTWENATYSDALLDEGRFPDRTVVVFTSAYHSRRALSTFQKVMPERQILIDYPDNTVVLADTFLGRWRGLYNLTREYLANAWYMVAHQVSPQQQATQFVKGERLDFKMADGTRLVGDYYAGVGTKAVILVHMLGSNRHVWDPYIDTLRAKGWSVLAIDMRGQGESSGDYHAFTDADYNKMPTDISSLAVWFAQQNPKLKIAVVGASIGANAALVSASEYKNVAGVVALSPAADYHGIKTSAAVKALQVPALFVVAQDDAQSFPDAKTLYAATPEPEGTKQYLEYALGGHGTAMLESQPELMSKIVAFINGL